MKSSTHKLLLCLVVLLFATGSAFATDRYVNGQSGGEYMGLYASVQAALDDAVSGDIIYIYGDGEVPPVPGADPGNASYGGGATVFDDNLMIYFVGDVVLSDGTNTLNAFNLSGRTDIMIVPDPVDGGTLAINGYLNGIVASVVTNLTVSDATLDGNTNGIHVNVTNGDFSALTITNGTYGFWLTGAAGVTLDDATIDNNTAAGIVTNGSDVAVSNCGLTSNGTGIVLNGTNVSVTDCDVTSGTNGMVINATGAVVTGCDVMANSDGLNLGNATGLDINGNTIKNNNNRGIIVTGNAQGDIYNNNIQKNDIGIRVNFDYSALATSRLLNIYENCLGDNDTYAAYDVNAYGAPTEVVWWSLANVGNYWGAFYDGLTSSYFIPGGANEDKYPTTATNNPDGPDNVALGQTFSVDFVFTIPALCDPYQFLKTCHFVVGYDDNLMEITSVDAGDYLPDVEMITNPVQGAYEIDLTALGDGNHATEMTGVLATANFVALSDAVGADQITLGSTYIDADGIPITVTSAPLDIAVEDQIPPEIRKADLIDSPTEDATYSPAFPLTLDWTIWDDFNLYRFQWRVVDDGGTQVIGWANVDGVDPGDDGEVSGTNTLDVSSLTTGDYYLELRLKDTGPVQHTVLWDMAKSGALAFHIDATAPATPTFTIADSDGCADAGLSSNLAVDFTITNAYGPTDEGKVQWAYASDWRAIFDFEYNFQITLDDFDGDHNMYLRVTDVYGNTSGWGGPVLIHVDRVAPDASLTNFSVPVKTKTLTRNASVDQWGDAGSTEYAYSVDNVVDGAGVDLTCDDADWQPKVMPIPANFPFTLPDGPDGDYEVCMVVRDGEGNVSSTVCDVIALDRTAPCFDTYSLTSANGMPCSNSWTFNINMTFTNDPAYVRFWVDGGTTGKSSWIAVTGDPMVYSYTILAGDRSGYGTYTIKGEVRDALGNICATEGSGDIVVDGTNPSSGLAMINGANSWPWSYSPTATIPVTFPDASADAIEALVSELSDFAGATWQDINATEITLTLAQCGLHRVYYKVRDCSGRESGQTYGYVGYDTEAPDLTAFVIFSDDPVTKKVNLRLDMTATDNCAITEFIASEGDDDFSDDTWQDWSVTPHKYLLVNQDDGTKTIYVKVRDAVGHESVVMSDQILLDRTPPTGAINIVANASCGAAAGYTCTLDDNIIEFSGVDADVVAMEIENCAGSGNMMVDPFDPATTSMVWDLAGGGEGNRCVHVKFKDAANNWSTDWIAANIMYDTTPLTFSGGAALVLRPGDAPSKDGGWAHSIYLEWPDVAGAQYYGLNWQRTTDYPDYDVPFPNFPPTIADEFFGPHNLTGTSTTFETVELPGIYFLSLFVQDMAGNWSTSKLTGATTNYYLGDFGEEGDGIGLMGGLRIDDFQYLAQNYFTPTLHPYEQLFDIGPTHNGDIYGYPAQDGVVNFDDMVEFTFVFDAHPLAGRSGAIGPAPGHKPIVSGNMVVSADLPNQFYAGQEFETVVRVNDASAVKLMSLTLEYNSDLLEAISVQPGDMFNNDNAFLLNCITDAAVQMDGTILGADNVFTGSEIAKIRFRAKGSGSFQFNDPKIILRDRMNQDIQVLFSNIAAPSLPSDFALSQNRPNPFNPTTTFDLYLPTACDWRCEIFNVAGQIIKTVSGHDEAGTVPITWNGTDANGSRVASGIYFYRITADDGRFTQTKKMVLMK